MTIERRALLAGAIGSTLAVGAAAPARAADNDWTQDFTSSRRGWIDVLGTWSLRGGKLTTRVPAGDRRMHSVRFRRADENFILRVRVRHTGPGTTSFILRGNPTRLRGAGEWSPSYRLGFDQSGMGQLWRIDRAGRATAMDFAHEAGPGYVRGGWNDIDVVAAGTYLAINVGGSWSVAVDDTLTVGSWGIATSGPGSRLEIDSVQFSDR